MLSLTFLLQAFQLLSRPFTRARGCLWNSGGAVHLFAVKQKSMPKGDELLSYRRGAEATRGLSTVLVQWVLTGASKDDVSNEI